MTIAISVRVNDGIVLAADSTTTLVVQGPSGVPISAKAYNNANKIFNLRKGYPIGLITWGAGSIGQASIATLAKDLRQRFDSNHKDWAITDNWNVLDVARKVRRFFYEELYVPQFGQWPQKPILGFLVVGYSPNQQYPEEYLVQIDNAGACAEPHAIRGPTEVGVTWYGFFEPLTRLILGFAPNLPTLLKQRAPAMAEQLDQAFESVRPALSIPVIQAAMPLQDAIDLAKFLAEVALGYSRFIPGIPIVGGPIEVAAITRHESFKWVSRKYYFERSINPETDDAKRP